MLQMFALGEMPDFEPEQAEILERMPEDFEFRIGSKHGQPVFDIPTLDEVEPAVVPALEPELESASAFEHSDVVDEAAPVFRSANSS